ncbi:MAG TPA: ActD-like protein [Polyangia bacterium]|nr:ActD-like protein [Polyangia bacterium]
MSSTDKKTPAWLLERLAQGELDREAAHDVRARLTAEGRSPDDEIAALARDDRETLAEHPPAAVAAEIARRAAARRPAARRPFVFAAAFAAAGALAMVLVGRQPAAPVPDGAPALEQTTIKGPPQAWLYVYRHGGDRDRRLADGERAAPGDLLQLAYATTGRDFGVLFSIDGAGTVTQHLPEPGAARALPLRVGGEMRLPSAYELDSAPAFERFFLVHAAQPFDVAPVINAARTLAARTAEARHAPLALPAAFGQISLTLEKTR